MVDAKELALKLEIDDIIKILSQLGHDAPPRKQKDGWAFRTSLCHKGINYNLIFYEHSKNFYCHSECKKKYSIYDLIMLNLGCSFNDALRLIIDYVGWGNTISLTNKKESEPWNFLQSYKKLKVNYDNLENPVYPDSILNQFFMFPVKSWLSEGLSYEAQKFFEVGTSIEDERIIVPHRHWETGEIIGVMGRTVHEDFKQQGIPKWFPIYHFNHNLNIHGLWQNKQAILEKQEVILTESEKSPILARSMGINNVVDISGKTLSQQQVKILIKLGVRVVLALDKDVTLEQNKAIVDKLKWHLPVFVIVSKNCNKLDTNDSPLDKGYEVFKELYDSRIRVK